MKSLLPSLKEKKRYVAFEVISDERVNNSEAYVAIKESMLKFIGELGMAKAGLQFVPEKWDGKKQRGIARVSHTSAELLKASFVFITKINNKKAMVRSLGVSGILNKAQRYFAK